MAWGWLRWAAAMIVGVIAVVVAVPLVRDHPIRAGAVAAGATPQTVDGQVAYAAASGGGASLDFFGQDADGTASATTPQTVPPTSTTTTTLVRPSTTPAAAPATASATTTTVTSAPLGATSPIGTRALAMIRYPWTKLGYQLAFHGPKAGFLGLTDCRTRHIDIYVGKAQSVAQVAYVTAFEIGHAIDCSNQVPGHQAEWPILRGFHYSGPWYPSCSCSEDVFASGDFAEVFARWQVGAAYSWRSTLAPPPNAAQLATLVPLFG